AVPVTLVGCVLAARRDRPLGRVLVCVALVPVALVAVIGIRTHLLLPRTLMFVAWAPAIGLGSLVAEAVRRRDAVWGIAAATVVGVLVVPAALTALRHTDRTWAAMHHVRREAHPGDVVAVNPSWLWPRTHWYLGVRRAGPERPITLPNLAADGLLLGSGDWNGRVWLIEPAPYAAGSFAYTSCAPDWSAG